MARNQHREVVSDFAVKRACNTICELAPGHLPTGLTVGVAFAHQGDRWPLEARVCKSFVNRRLGYLSFGRRPPGTRRAMREIVHNTEEATMTDKPRAVPTESTEVPKEIAELVALVDELPAELRSRISPAMRAVPASPSTRRDGRRRSSGQPAGRFV